MYNIVFCFNENNKRIDDAFEFTSRTDIIEKEASLLYYRRFLTEILQGNREYVPVKMLVRSRGELHVLEIEKINYIEIFGRIVAIHLDEETVEAYAALEEMEERLWDLGFFRVHRSFLVSVNKIKKVSRTSLVLENGEELPVGKTYYKKVKERLEEWYTSL
ncbi:MAG: LytTR family transcriptional regulator DNA-binding domain-containing protein [Lachnospiraceae bacterium]|nr:LytTR family transcriptional regulator DNA-binding domain-containing protein [Lachnospiraceae bacterium]